MCVLGKGSRIIPSGRGKGGEYRGTGDNEVVSPTAGLAQATAGTATTVGGITAMDEREVPESAAKTKAKARPKSKAKGTPAKKCAR